MERESINHLNELCRGLTFGLQESLGSLHDLSAHHGVEEGVLLPNLERVLILRQIDIRVVVVLHLNQQRDGGAAEGSVGHGHEQAVERQRDPSRIQWLCCPLETLL